MRVECPCGSSLFQVYAPPPKTKPGQREVYLICEGCRKTWKLKSASLPEVDDQGVLKSHTKEVQP
jgi:hypothetical protein